MTETAVLIIGVGNPLRGDDGAAAAVTTALRAQGIPAVDFDGDGVELMDLWSQHRRVIIIDAAISGQNVGTVHRFLAHREALPQNFFRHSTHQFGVAEAVEMARTLNRLPAELIVYGIEGINFTLGDSLSPDVALSVHKVVQAIASDIG